MNTCSGLLDTVSIVTLQHTFPRNRGPVLALAKVMTGLGSSVFASISSNLFADNLSGFLYFVMVYAMVVSLVGCFVIVLPPYALNWWRERCMTEEEKETSRSLSVVYDSKNVPVPRLAIGYTIVISLILFFSTSSPIIAYMGISQQARYAIGALTCLMVCSFGFLALPLRCLGGVDEPSPALDVDRAGDGAAAPRSASSTLDTEPTTMREHASTRAALPAAPHAEVAGLVDKDVQKRGEMVEMNVDVVDLEYSNTGKREAHLYAAYMDPDAIKYTDPKYPGTIWDALRHVDIYLIYLGFILQASIGTIVTYNASTIYVARTGRSRSTQLSALYTAFFGIGSALGRIAVGIFEAFVQRQPEGKRRLLVTMVLPVPAIIGTIGGILILILPGGALLLPYIMIYFKEGFFYSTCAIVFPSLYRTHLSIYYNLSCATMVVSVVCFNRFLFGYMVDKKRDELHLSGECTSRDCILTPIVVSICFCAVAFVLFIVAHIRYSRFVRRCERDRAAADRAMVPQGGAEPTL
ncbi:hypothetical protein STCU_07316 [Strigomonas culicis]|uniref:Nodulin-like domain-containing protein n=1 Tax=Strigomonas culicis TaxID=28005 RepID=S9VAX3_9TRYP|nr:hypothetical protein STCU_07316 [Strigomonas culicis]|eukprot:EPY24161.1 hypothetical protein STCU_07316 [Strigomonas culicis]